MKKLKLKKEVIAILTARQMDSIEGGFTFSRCPLCNAASTIIGDHCTDPGAPESGAGPARLADGNCTGTSPSPSVFDCSNPQGDSYCTCPA